MRVGAERAPLVKRAHAALEVEDVRRFGQVALGTALLGERHGFEDPGEEGGQGL